MSHHGYQIQVWLDVIPQPGDNSTLFVCSGMQRFKKFFPIRSGTGVASFQKCIRTNDIDLVGDGTHLTSFDMVGNFSFDALPYSDSISMWNDIMLDLNLKLGIVVHVHPSQPIHRKMWEDHDYKVIDDESCHWSDGEIGGYCCELYHQGLEIGNLVNTLGHSTDVGFGLERLLQRVECKDRIDETSLFNMSLENRIIRDHVRTIELMLLNGVSPKAKARSTASSYYRFGQCYHRTIPISDWDPHEITTISLHHYEKLNNLNT